MLWIIVITGVVLSFIGDWLVLISAKSGNLFQLLLASLLFGISGIPWYLLVRYYTGWIQGSVLWGLVGVFASLFLAFISNEKQTTIQWIGLVIMFLGIAIRSIK